MVGHHKLYQLDMKVTQMSLSLSRAHNSRGMLSNRLPKTTGSDHCPLHQHTTKKEEEIIKVHVQKMKHLCTDELEIKLNEKEVNMIRLLDEEKHLRNALRELLGKHGQKKVLKKKR